MKKANAVLSLIAGIDLLPLRSRGMHTGLRPPSDNQVVEADE